MRTDILTFHMLRGLKNLGTIYISPFIITFLIIYLLELQRRTKDTLDIYKTEVI